MSAVIEVGNLIKNYRSGKVTTTAVNGVTFKVEQGEVFGILGPNGAGKTTTLEIIEGLKTQTSGDITVLGLNNLTHRNAIKHHIGVQLQASSYLHSITLSELLELFASLYGKKINTQSLLGLVGLESKAREVVQNLSGGQQQRFTVAAALVHEPEILFLDEPTTGLDPRARRELWQIIRNVNTQGTTIVLTTHYMEEAEYLCDRVAIMDNGKILTINNPKTLVNELKHTTQISFFTNSEQPESFWLGLPGVEKVYSNYPKVILEITRLDAIGQTLETLKQHQITLSGFTVKTATLEDVYLDLTGRELTTEHTN